MSIIIVFNENNIAQWKSFIKNISQFLNLYNQILNAYVLDFFSKNLWDSLNFKWKSALANFDSSDLSNFLSKGCKLRKKEVLPLGLLSFRATCFSYMLPRNPPKSAVHLNDNISNLCNRHTNLSAHERSNFHSESLVNRLSLESTWESASKELSPEGGQHLLLEHIFRKHLKPKKQHEVVRMAQLSSFLYHASVSKMVVDIGSGQGHLARLIGYGFGIPTICLDAEEDFINGARKFDQQLETSLKQKTKEKMIGPQHGICQLHPDLADEDIRKVLKKAYCLLDENKKWDEKEIPFSLLGLHSCGDLGPTMMRLFTSLSSCKSLLLVGCCYMKLSTKSEKANLDGYPMSAYVQSLPMNDLSYAAREMACHAIENYSNKLQNSVEDLKVHCYRAVLEELIVQKRPELEHSGLRSVKNAHKIPFEIYAQKALSRLEGFPLSALEFSTEEIRTKLEDWMKVVIFYSLRLLMAPAVESLVLLDRLLYLHEKEYTKSFLTPVFDPNVSPRNYALVVMKDENLW